MSPTEPFATALFLTTFGVLLALSIIFSRAAERFAVPVALVFLGIGMLAGSVAASVAMIVRGSDVVPPKGNTTIEQGDHVYGFARPDDRPFIHLMFGRPEGD